MVQSAENRGPGMGWLPDYPDFRDYTAEHNKVSTDLKQLGQKNSVKSMLSQVGVAKPAPALASSSDLRPWCSPVENQLTIGSCTAHAGIGIVEYFERRAFGKHTDASRLFLYKTTRNLLRWRGDSGAFIRSTMGALVLFGVPPEEYYPYVVADFDKEPSAFCYAYAQSFQAISYYRMDAPGIGEKELLKTIKSNLSAGLPSMFGFTVFSSVVQAAKSGMIPFPAAGEKVVGGHAVVAVGYDDSIRIKNSSIEAKETKGALLIRNSWGSGWGMEGYGWLPYEYVLKGVAIDWWSLLKNEWIDTGIFKA
ncbi:C1 family peptidase [Chlorobium ferrooxidans]|uniref:Peptidase C1A, papain n=1 Tax=Chlorobium ferrooxidans DSM 13031 TaxID=377431 RepID=Q0YST4_9CHLB|nr:C1 family peptidase [Chlorobium ferrooxidans]EAT59312.1 Peptidase C1A, papain [Chlorobium ferrooxidans DSM 13031]